MSEFDAYECRGTDECECVQCRGVRADERRRVEAEIGARLRKCAASWREMKSASADTIAETLESYAETLERGEHRPTGQPTGTAREHICAKDPRTFCTRCE